MTIPKLLGSHWVGGLVTVMAYLRWGFDRQLFAAIDIIQQIFCMVFMRWRRVRRWQNGLSRFQLLVWIWRLDRSVHILDIAAYPGLSWNPIHP